MIKVHNFYGGAEVFIYPSCILAIGAIPGGSMIWIYGTTIDVKETPEEVIKMLK